MAIYFDQPQRLRNPTIAKMKANSSVTTSIFTMSSFAELGSSTCPSGVPSSLGLLCRPLSDEIQMKLWILIVLEVSADTTRLSQQLQEAGYA